MPTESMRACSSVTMPLISCTCKCCCTERRQHLLLHKTASASAVAQDTPVSGRQLGVTELSKGDALHATAEGMIVNVAFNGVQASRLRRVAWRKSRYSNPSGNCVEAAQLPAGAMALRNSRYPDGPALVFTRAEWDAFLLGARDGDFDRSDTW